MTSVKIEGLAALEKELNKLSKAAGKSVLRRSLKKAVEPAIAAAKANVPVASGALIGSIDVSLKLAPRQAGLHRKMFKDDRAAVELFLGPSYSLGAGGRHGHLVEFGTYKTAPQPFMRPAWDQEAQPTLDRLARHLWDEFEKSRLRAARKAAKE
jgi:HK97 gp10 family phage protein